jgi:tetratricopeptide (TPR) repeat protein
MKMPPENPEPKAPASERPATPDEVLKQLHEGQFPLAQQLAERLLQTEPQNALGHHLLAMTHLAQGRTDEALDALDQAVELHEQGVSTFEPQALAHVYATRALVELQQDDLDDAAEDAKAALALNPDEPDALFVATVTASDALRWEEAHQHASRLAHLDPENADAQAFLARILFAQGKKAEASQAAVRARALGFTTSELEDIERQGAE